MEFTTYSWLISNTGAQEADIRTLEERFKMMYYKCLALR